ncbi:MAG TPA: alpha/beta fold hydrolase [Alphaproteobacteria bacterium]|nr:alpha/beta fold hydrolase [Alphaproteobacteria bacterium]
MKPMYKLALVVGTYLFLAITGGVAVSEGSLKLQRRPLTHQAEFAARVSDRYQADLQDVSVVAADGAVLKGWYVRPRKFNGSTVVGLHGITDNREGVFGYGLMFLEHGYAVLLPDARDHGESGGEIATYGVKEADDLRRWVSWIYEHDPPRCVYGFGESYGAALLLQSLAKEPRYCAVVAESTFSTAREMSYERIARPLHLNPWVMKTAGRVMIESAGVYSKVRYGVNILSGSPLDAVKHSSVPVLLIHGEQDVTISPRHSKRIAEAAPDHVQLWLVPNAGHTGAWSAAPQEFELRVLGWFAEHKSAAR